MSALLHRQKKCTCRDLWCRGEVQMRQGGCIEIFVEARQGGLTPPDQTLTDAYYFEATPAPHGLNSLNTHKAPP